MWAGREEKLKADARCERADTSKRDARYEKQKQRRLATRLLASRNCSSL